MITTKKQAEDLIYRSYMLVGRRLDYNAPDSEKRHPEYTRTVIRQLDERCGAKNILVTGSKGKGSVSVMINDILRAHGKNTGLLTSPHIFDFNERIRLNGVPIPDEELIKHCDRLAPTLELMDITIGEREYISPVAVQVMAALLHFYGKTDYNIFECGKGVLYDDVNNLGREYSVINTIFEEHTRELGGGLEEIAFDKSHIIVGGQKCAYSAQQTPKVCEILEKRAADCGVVLKTYGRDFYCENIVLSENGTDFDAVTPKNRYEKLHIQLLGEHQARNFALALCVCEDILGNTDKEKTALAARSIVWRGRLEIISRSPLTVADCCINGISAAFIKPILEKIKRTSLAAVLAVPADKDYRGVAREISDIADKIIFTRLQNPHYKFDRAQADCVRGGVFADDMGAAARLAAKSADTVCILGTAAMLREIEGYDEAIHIF